METIPAVCVCNLLSPFFRGKALTVSIRDGRQLIFRIESVSEKIRGRFETRRKC